MAYQWVKFGIVALGLGVTGLGHNALGSEPAVSEGKLWPLTTPPALSSSFGEFRDGHLHAGIDVRTFGQEGVPCRAVADGYVTRIRASIFGYGKALYFRLGNGETAVYAHLSEFSPRLETFLFKEQQRKKSYEVDLYQKPGRFQFKKGEIIGYTGSTGGVAPHLHFEIRDVGEHPMNPLTHGWSLQDRTPPHFEKIVWIPRDRRSRLDGSPFPRELPVYKESGGQFMCRDTVVLAGSWGIAARIFDRLGNDSGRLAPYRMDLLADDRLLARLDLERFSFAQSGQLELVYDMERALASNRHYFTLFEREGETVWNRWFDNGGLIISDSLSAGGNPGHTIHQVKIQATDPAGNMSTLVIPIRLVGAGAAEKPPPVKYRPVHSGAPAGLYIFDDIVCMEADYLDDETATRLSAALDYLGLQAGSPSARTGEGTFVLASRDLSSRPVVPLDTSASRDLYLMPVSAGRAGLRIIPDLNVCLHFNGDSFYGDALIYVKPADLPADVLPAPGELTPLLPVLYLGPPSLALRSPIDLSFPAPDSAYGPPAVYRLNERKNRWDHLATELRADSIRVQVRKAGVYKVFADSTCPRIGTPQLVRHRMYSGDRACPEIVIPLEDSGSGVDGLNSKVLLAEQEQIVRWDSSSKNLFVLLPDQNILNSVRGDKDSTAGNRNGERSDFYQSPEYEMKIIAVDRVGNVAVFETSLSIPVEYFSIKTERNSKDVE